MMSQHGVIEMPTTQMDNIIKPALQIDIIWKPLHQMDSERKPIDIIMKPICPKIVIIAKYPFLVDKLIKPTFESGIIANSPCFFRSGFSRM